MMQTPVLGDASRTIAGVVLITIVTIEIGGWFRKSFARAGHGHAGMLVTLGLVCLVLADAAALATGVVTLGLGLLTT